MGGKLQKWISVKQKVKFDNCNFIKAKHLRQRFFSRKLLQNDGKNTSNIKNCKIKKCRVVKVKMLRFAQSDGENCKVVKGEILQSQAPSERRKKMQVIEKLQGC